MYFNLASYLEGIGSLNRVFGYYDYFTKDGIGISSMVFTYDPVTNVINLSHRFHRLAQVLEGNLPKSVKKICANLRNPWRIKKMNGGEATVNNSQNA